MVQELTILHVTLTLAEDNNGPLLKEEVEREERSELLRKARLGRAGVSRAQRLNLKVTQ